MKLHWSGVFAAMLLGMAVGQVGLHAGEKEKKVEQKKQELKETIVDDALTNADLKDKVLTESFCKTYTYKMTKGRTYQIDLITGAFDAYLRLENPKGEQVAADDDSGGALNSRIRYVAPDTGDFTVCAMSLGGGSTGKFKLIVKDVTVGEPKVGDAKSLDIKNDKGKGSYTGTLENNDPQYMGKRHKLLTFQMEAGKTYQIDMTSNAFDSYLFLEDADKNVVGRDDDGGGFPSARITYKAAKTGKHRIISTYFGNGTGEFTVTIRQTDPAVEEPKEGKKD